MTLFNKTINPKLSLYIGIVLTILALAYQEFLTHIELGIHDEPWHIANCWNPEEYPMTFLPYVIGNWYGSLFGFSLLAFRHVALFINILSVAIVMLPLIVKKRHTTTIWLLGLLLWGILYPNLWGYDCISNLFLSLILLCCYFYYSRNRRNIILLITIGALVALFSLSRLPNILTIPCIIMYLMVIGMLEKEGRKRILINIISFSIAVIIVYALIIWLYYGSINDYVSRIIIGSMGEATSNHHSIRGLVISYFYWALPRIFLATTYIAILGYVYYITTKSAVKKGYNQRFTLLLVSICTVCLTYTYLMFVNDQFNSGTFWFRNGILLFLAILSVIKTYKHPHFKSWATFVLFMLFIAAIPAAGSNTGLSKVASILVIPLIINDFNWRKDKLIMVFIASLLFGQVLHTLYFYSENGFENRGWKYNTERITYDKIDVYTIPYVKESFDSLSKECQNDKKSNRSTLFIGDQRFLYNYIANVKVSAPLHTFYEDISNAKYQQAIVDHINKNQCDIVYVVNEYNKLKVMSDKQQAFHTTADSLLQANGFIFDKFIDNTGYKKYVKY